MIFKWLGSELLGLTRGWWLLIALALLVASVIIARGWFDAALDTAADAGASRQREQNATATIKQVEKANAASENLDRDADARRADCLRDARNPANC